jgi:hypothetical protein
MNAQMTFKEVIVQYYAIRQAENEAYLRTPKGNTERLQNNLERLHKEQNGAYYL